MRRFLIAVGMTVGITVAATFGLAGLAGAAPQKHFQVGQQWTVEILFGPGQSGACAVETVGPNGTLTFRSEALGNGLYTGSGRFLSESFTDPFDHLKFRGSWSATLSEFTGQWKVKGSGNPGTYPGQVVPGAVTTWANFTCW
jgi:hypothetical protein